MNDPNLFRGTASYYERYRLQYPGKVFAFIRSTFHLDGKGVFLDLGCGTGRLTFPLTHDFARVIAVDPDAEMLAMGSTIAEKRGDRNIQWVLKTAEEFFPTDDTFRLVGIGSAFHWMDQRAILPHVHHSLTSGGGLVLVNGESWWNGKQEWQKEVIGAVKEFLGEERRAGSGTFAPPGKPYKEMLEDANFSTETFKFNEQGEIDIDTILGMLYSSSFASKALFGNKVDAFDKRAREVLSALNPQGTFSSPNTTSVIIGWPKR